MDEMLRKENVLKALSAKIDELEKRDAKADVILGLATAMSVVKLMGGEPAEKQEPCTDAISRQAMHIELEKWITYGEYKYSNATKYLYDRIDRLPPVNPAERVGHWIPVSERLPEMGVRVLCACQADLYDVLKLTPEGWFYDTRHTYMFGFVRAWMPLPEPYTEGGEQNDND